MATVREVLTLRIQSLRDRKQHLVAEVTAIQARIDALVAERDALTLTEEDKFARFQSLDIIQTQA
jgi:FtsZ-binding cell division protein ZapB